MLMRWMTGCTQEPELTDARQIFRQIVIDELDACVEGADRLLVYPSIQGMWEGGLSYGDHLRVRKTADDLGWWFVEEFADPQVAAAVKRVLDSVPQFFFNLVALSGKPVVMDWKFINGLRNHLRAAAWPPPYEVAVGSTASEASMKAADLVRRLTTAEQWRIES